MAPLVFAISLPRQARHRQGELRFIQSHLAFRLIERRLVRPLVDLKENVILFYIRAWIEIDFHQIARDLRADFLIILGHRPPREVLVIRHLAQPRHAHSHHGFAWAALVTILMPAAGKAHWQH